MFSMIRALSPALFCNPFTEFGNPRFEVFSFCDSSNEFDLLPLLCCAPIYDSILSLSTALIFVLISARVECWDTLILFFILSYLYL